MGKVIFIKNVYFRRGDSMDKRYICDEVKRIKDILEL